MARGALWTFLTLAAFFCADSLIFRAGWYNAYLEPFSSAGFLELQLHWLRSAAASDVPEVLVVGDSRVAEGFSSPVASAAVDGRLRFWNFGLAGTMPRVWYYALRDADPTRRRFAAIVFAIEDYSDRGWTDAAEDRISDENFLAMRLGFGDCNSFAASMQDPDVRRSAMFHCLFRGVLLRQDAQAFLSNPRTRIKRARDWWKNGLTNTSRYTGKSESLRGLTVDWQRGSIQFPDGVSETVRANLSATVAPDPGKAADGLSRYRQRWLGGILDLYKNSSTRIIFLQLPRGPLIRPETARAPGFIDSAARVPGVTVLPEETFADLERPEVFADDLHLNREGRPVFSTRLAGKVESVLAGGGR